MRLISKSLTESVYSVINEQSDAKQAVYDVFDGTDFFVNEVYSIGDGLVKFNVTAFDGDGKELNRDVEVSIPNDDYYDIEQDSYEAVFNCVEAWRDEHNTSELFYEGVMINTGSTTITSDETGVVVEDNGNTITVGNGVTVDVDNEADVLPAEMDLVAPVEDETAQAGDIEELPLEPAEEDLEENATEDFHGTTELARQVFVSLQKDENGKYLVMRDGVVTEEIEASNDNEAIEKFNQKYQKLEDDNLNEAEQSIDIFANPEFDYKITDITVLQPTDAGDVRAIDMNDILVGLDEALTARYNNPNYITLNSFQGKCGKQYSSAIVDISWPECKGYVCTFESSFDNGIYDCVIKETATNRRIEHSCVKTTNPIKAFENAIVDLVSMRHQLVEHERVFEDAEVVHNISHVEDNNGVTYTDDTRVATHDEHVEKNVKDREKLLKKDDKFDIGEEPDQKNTQGEEVAKINLKEADETTISKLKELKARLEAGNEDLDTIASELDIICDEAGYERLWEEGLTLMELAKQAIQNAMKDDFDNGASMLKHLDDTNAQYAYIDGYGNYRNLTTEFLDNLLYDVINDMSVNESIETPLEDEIEEPVLEEDTMPKAIFHRKPSNVEAMKAEEESGIVTNTSAYNVINTKELSSSEFEAFANNLSGSYEWLKELYNAETLDSGAFNCIEVTGGDYSILVDPSGYDYARYAAIKGEAQPTIEETPIEEEPITEE